MLHKASALDGLLELPKQCKMDIRFGLEMWGVWINHGHWTHDTLDKAVTEGAEDFAYFFAKGN
jgi:hypothetical protein